MIYYPLFLLPLVAYSSWCAFKLVAKHPQSQRKNLIPRGYFVGLNYLLSEQPDKAVDIFIKMLEVDSDTVETHLALGSLFRRRGEVDRAIRIHQNLIARPQLEREERVLALLALGQDYLHAGVLDRAERLFQEIVDLGGDAIEISLENLILIYEQEKSWDQAIAAAEQYERVANTSKGIVIAQYYCELAALAKSKRDYDTVFRCLRKAVAIDNQCVRAYLMLGDYYSQQGQYKLAIRNYQQLLNQDPDYLPEIILPMASCYKKRNKVDEYQVFLEGCIEHYSSTAVVVELVRLIKRDQGLDAAIELMHKQLQDRPSLRGLQELIRLQFQNSKGSEQTSLNILRDITDRLLGAKPIYRCKSCGYSGKKQLWLCPGCRQWSTIKPIHGIEGD